MKNVTDSFVFLGHWPSAESFGVNTDILATNLINQIELERLRASASQAPRVHPAQVSTADRMHIAHFIIECFNSIFAKAYKRAHPSASWDRMKRYMDRVRYEYDCVSLKKTPDPKVLAPQSDSF